MEYSYFPQKSAARYSNKLMPGAKHQWASPAGHTYAFPFKGNRLGLPLDYLRVLYIYRTFSRHKYTTGY
jgi:hypothetical protein